MSDFKFSKVEDFNIWRFDESFVSKIDVFSVCNAVVNKECFRDSGMVELSNFIKFSSKEIIFVVKMDGLSVFNKVPFICVSSSLILSVLFKFPGIIESKSVDKIESVIGSL